jgi:hypothetical protein
MSSLLMNNDENILDNNYSENFLDNISRNITNVLDDTIMFNSGIEEFDSDIPKHIKDEQEAREKEMTIMLDDRNRKLSDYSNKHKNLLEKTVSFLDATAKNNRYSGSNIRFTNGTIGYVTQKGYFKHYPSWNIFKNTSGKNGCPTNWEQLDIYFRPEYHKEGSVIPTDPPLIVGAPMTTAQPCGKEGRNIQVTTIAPKNSPFSYRGCYEAAPKSTQMEFQSDLGSKSTFSNCKTRAHDRGYNVFAMRDGSDSGSKCYIGKNLNSAKSNGIATRRNVSYQLLPNNVYKNQQMKGGLMKNGQIGVGPRNTGPVNWQVTRFTPNTRCHKELGGYVNTNNTTASYGVNCNGRIKWR